VQQLTIQEPAIQASRFRYLGTRLFRVLLLCLAVLAVFAATASAAAFLVSRIKRAPLTDPWCIYLGIVCGLIAWLFVFTFHIKRETALIIVQRPSGFLDQVRKNLEELGYHVEQRDDGHLTARPRFHSLLFGGGFDVRLEDHAARVTGPKVYVEVLRNRLRMESFVGKAQKSIWAARKRQGERLLCRVQISLRVPAEHWQAFRAEVIDVLAGEDADVVCEVNLLAHSEPGIRDSTVDNLIRSWLERHQLKAEIHKEPLHSRETPSSRDTALPAPVPRQSGPKTN
jgi:hypothetical protein